MEAAYKVLIVDDEPIVRQATMRSLAKTGFDCQSVPDARQALELLAHSLFDVVISDLRMPGMNGHALATEVLQLPERPIVVVLTGVTEPRLAKDLMAKGVDHIEYKPTDYAALASKIQSLAKVRAERRVLPPAPSFQATPATMLQAPIEKTLPSPASAGLSTLKHEPPAIVQNDPPPLDVALNLVSALTTRIQDLDRALSRTASSAPSKLSQAPIAIFVGGVICGWLVSWLGAGGWLLR